MKSRAFTRTAVILAAATVSLVSAGPAGATSTGITVVIEDDIPFAISGTVLPGVFVPPSTITIPYECHAAAVGSSQVTIPTSNHEDPDEHGCSLWEDQTNDPRPNVHNWVEIDHVSPGTSAPGEVNAVGTAEEVTVSGKGFRVCWYGFANAIVGGGEADGRGCSDGTNGATLAMGRPTCLNSGCLVGCPGLECPPESPLE